MTPDTPEQVNRKPRVALMGEFSAGKSTLANLLMGEDISPTQITATQLPPIWYAHGAERVCLLMQDGTEKPLKRDIGTLEITPDIRAIRIFLKCDFLKACDLIDMPGSSDPNMSAEAWQSMMPLADAVLWCTPAPQAWRQSEAAIWENAPPHLWEKSLLLLTRIDKIPVPTDRDRIVRRVSGEASGLFRDVLPVALLEAATNRAAWSSSGMTQIIKHLRDIVSLPQGDAQKPDQSPLRAPKSPLPAQAAETSVAPKTSGIMPKRVVRAEGEVSARSRVRRSSCGSVI